MRNVIAEEGGPERAPEDAEAVFRFVAGDEEAFERLYHRYRPLVFSTALRIVRNRDDAEDVTAEVFWRVFRKIATYDERRPFSPWISRIALHESFSLLRRRRAHARRFAPMPLREPAVESAVERSLALRQLAARARAIVRELPCDQSRAVRLHDAGEVPGALLSRSLRIPLPTLKSRLRRARRAIRAQMENPFLPAAAPSAAPARCARPRGATSA
ncbi:MAG: RNA polymerase sigma factor [Acidobacteriota bacterium]